MQHAQIGPWQFGIPEHWAHTENESSNAYFESPEGDKGLYVKLVLPQEPLQSPTDLAEYIQGAHKKSFTETTDRAWNVLDQRHTKSTESARSVLDLYDKEENYRILSLVMSTCASAIQITVHDYWCEDYETTREQFQEIENSIDLPPTA